MRVFQVMTTEPLSVDVADDFKDAYELMQASGNDQLPVTNDGRLVGVVAADAMRARLDANECDREARHMSDVMRSAFDVCHPLTTVAEACSLMRTRDVTCLYVTSEDGRLLGMVDDAELMSWCDAPVVDVDPESMGDLLRRYAAERDGKADVG